MEEETPDPSKYLHSMMQLDIHTYTNNVCMYVFLIIVSVDIEITFTPTYPDVLPSFVIHNKERAEDRGFDSTQISQLTDKLRSTAST